MFEVKQMLGIYTGCAAICVIAIAAGGIKEAEFIALLFIFGKITETIYNIVKNSWF